MAPEVARAQSPMEQLVRRHAADHPEQTWLKWKDERYAWSEALSNIQRAANGLAELGVRPGERVALMMANCPEFLWAHFAVTFLGAHSVPVNISQRGPTLQYILADAEVTTVVVQEDLRNLVVDLRTQLPTLRHTVVVGGKAGHGMDWDFDRVMSAPDHEPDVEIVDPIGGVGMMYTSGTTGPPKGVVAAQYDTTPIQRLLEASGVRPGETMYTPLPLFHGNALFVSAMGSILLDAQFALGERFSASRFWEECRRYDAVEFNTLGGMISILLKQPPSPADREHQVRVVLSAGCPPDRWEEFERRFGVRVVEWFGMVDAPGILLNDAGKVGSIGRAVAGVEFEVLDDGDRPLGPGHVGELVFRHPHGRLTYYNKLPEATDEAYRGGWFHSGDLAERDEEGFYYYRGRKKESMRRLGENISAWEIETVVNQHPAVLESAAHAVASDLGEDEVKLCVVALPGDSPSPEDLLDFCQGKMARHALPRYVEFLEELPKTGTQRVQYAVLKQRGITARTWDRQAAGYKMERS